MEYPPCERVELTGADQPRTAFLYPAETAATGRPIALIHGFRGDHHGLALIAGALRAHDAYVPDLPGFGTAPAHASPLTLEAYADWVSGLVEAVAAHAGVRPVLVGHSFGSILCAAAVAAEPDLTPALGLLNPITRPALEGPSAWLTGLTRLYYGLGSGLPEQAGTALLSHPLIVRAMSELMVTTHDPGLRRYVHDQHAKHFSTFVGRRALAEAFEISIARTAAEFAEPLAQAGIPLLLVSGDADPIAPPEPTAAFTEALRAAGADVDVRVEAGVGHLLHYERPEAVAEAVSRLADRCG